MNSIQTREMDLRYIPREVEGRDDEIKLHDVVATLLGSRWLIAATTCVVMTVGVFYARRASIHFSADELAQRGCMRFFSIGLSPLSRLKKRLAD